LGLTGRKRQDLGLYAKRDWRGDIGKYGEGSSKILEVYVNRD